MPAVAVIPALTSAITGTVLSQSITTTSSQPVQLMAGGLQTGLLNYMNSVSSQPSLSAQALQSLPVIVSYGMITSTYSQPVAAFDLQDSGLTALGIAASTREVIIIIIINRFV